jgi:hypothetical protein
MLVMESKNGEPTLVLAIIEDDLEQIKRDLTLTYFGRQLHHVQNVVILYGKDKPSVLNQIRGCGIEVSESWEKTYLAGERTDRQAKQ